MQLFKLNPCATSYLDVIKRHVFSGCLKKSTRTLRFREGLKAKYFATYFKDAQDTCLSPYEFVDGCEEIVEHVLTIEIERESM